jgi:hypothetical protein
MESCGGLATCSRPPEGRENRAVAEGTFVQSPRGGSRALDVTKTGQEPNGMKLTSERLLDQLLTQVLAGCDHEREALRSPLLDTRLHTMGACRVDDQRHQRHARTGCAEPPQGVQEADLLHPNVLERS